MSLRLNTLGTTPPGGFRYFVEETKTWIPDLRERSGSGHTAMSDLIDDLRRHYKANRIDAPSDLQLKVEDQICRSVPGGWCNEHGVPVHSGTQGGPGWFLDFTAMRQGTETLLRWALGGAQHVPQAEAERRGSICTSCQYNQMAVGCTSCNMPAITNLINQIRGGRQTRNDQSLQACSLCSCSLKAKVWLPLKPLRDSTPAAQMAAFPPHCWLLPLNDPPN